MGWVCARSCDPASFHPVPLPDGVHFAMWPMWRCTQQQNNPQQAELPAQPEMRLAGTEGFLPYKATAELIKHSLVGCAPLQQRAAQVGGAAGRGDDDAWRQQ